MRLCVKLFALAKDLAGADTVEVELPEGATVAELRHVLGRDCPPLARLLERCAVAVDNEFATNATALRAGAEVALLPPVSGG
jgi:molybdopterin converting factor subunit 1